MRERHSSVARASEGEAVVNSPNWKSLGRSGGTGLDDEVLAEHAKCAFDAGDGGAVSRVEHAAHGLFVDAESLGESDAGQAAFGECQGERGLGSGDSGHCDEMFAGPARAWHGDGIDAVDSPSDGLLEGVGCFVQGFGLIGAGGQAFGKVAERDDELAGRVGAKARWIGESHDGLLWDSAEIVSIESELTNHGRQEASSEVLPGISDDGKAVAVVERDVAAFAALGINTNRDTARTAHVTHLGDEFLSGHGSNSRSLVSEASSSIPDSPALSGVCGRSSERTLDRCDGGAPATRGREMLPVGQHFGAGVASEQLDKRQVDGEQERDATEQALGKAGLLRGDVGLELGLGLGDARIECGDVALELGSQSGDVALELGSQSGDVALELGSQSGAVGLERGAHVDEILLGGDVLAEPSADGANDGLGRRRIDAGVLKVLDGFVGIEKHRGHAPDDAPWSLWPSIRDRAVDGVVLWGMAVRSCVRMVLVGGGVLACASGALAQDLSEDACPRAALRQMMATAAAHDAVADVASIELEVLRLCTVRQALIVKIAEGESRLAELRGVAAASPSPAAVAVMSPPEETLPPPAKATQPVVVEPEAQPARWVPPPRVEPAPAVVRAPARAEYRWTTVYGSAGVWTAGVTDGVEVWYVRAGDVLPSGLTVESVRVRPPSVAVGRNGKAWQLPGPDG